MASDASKQFAQLSNDFNRVVEELKGTGPLVEELVNRAAKLQRHFDATSSALLGFLEAVQKVADVAGAASAYGGASDLGTCLTKVALRHRTIAEQYTSLSGTIGEDICKNLVIQMELRKRSLTAVEKEHEKDFKRWKADLKRRNESNLKLATKATGKKKGDRNIHDKLEESLEDSVELYEDFQTFEQASLRKVLLEERKHYSAILSALAPVMVSEVTVLDEVFHLQELSEQCKSLSESYDTLPAHSEHAVNNIQLDLSRLFREAPCQSPALQHARQANKLKRQSFLSLASDAMSMDNMSLASCMNPTIASDEMSATAISDGTDVSSPSLNAIRLDPDGCPGSASPEPMYADIDAMQNMATPPVSRSHPPAAAPPADARSSGGSSTELNSITSRSSLANNQPINPFGKPTASLEGEPLPEMRAERSMTLTRKSAKDSLAMLAKVIQPVAPKPPTRTALDTLSLTAAHVGAAVPVTLDATIYAEADGGGGEWPALPSMDDLPSPPPFEDLAPDLIEEKKSSAPPPVSSKPARPRVDSISKNQQQNRLSQSLDTLYSETRAVLSKRQTIAEPELDDVSEMFPPPPPPEECIYDEVNEAPPPPLQPSVPSSVSVTSDMAGSNRHAVAPSLPQYAVVGQHSPALQHKELMGRLRSGSTDAVFRSNSNRLPVQPPVRARSSSRPVEPGQTISMDV